jgi:hypothetical protein
VRGPLHCQDESFPQCLQARNAKRRRPGALLEHRQSPQIFCLTHQGRFALVIRKNKFILARTLFLPGGEVFNEAEPCNIQVKNPPQKHASKKDRNDGLRHSTNTKSPRGSALATLVCDNSMHKSPKGAAGLAQQVRKIEVYREDYPRRSRLRVSQTSTTSAKNRSLPRRLSTQKSPKGAAGLAQQVRKIEVYREDYPRRSRLRVQPD